MGLPIRRGRCCEGYPWTGKVSLQHYGRVSPRGAAAAFATAATVVVAPMPAPWRCRNTSAKRDESTGGTGRDRPVGQRDGRGADAAGAPGGCCPSGRGDECLRDDRRGGRPLRDAGPAGRPGCERRVGRAGQVTAAVGARSSSALGWEDGLATLQKSRRQVLAGRWAGGEGRW